MAQPITSAIDEIEKALKETSLLNRVIISGRRKGFSPVEKRIDIRPVTVRDEDLLQIVYHDGRRDLTKNFSPSEIDISGIVKMGYANILIEQVNKRTEIRISKSGDAFIHRSKVDASKQSREHDRNKERLLRADDPIFFALGLADKDGKLKPSRSDKFIQIDNFLRIIASSIPESKEINLVDLGCGNAYLTFAVHHFLIKQGRKVKTVGVDVKQQSRLRNTSLSDQLGYGESMEFVESEISDFAPRETDIVIALHACDTATDDAITWGVRSNAKLLLIAPCCHHDVNEQLKEIKSPLHVMGRNGLVRERMADLVTDSLRAAVLRALGFKTEIVEFVASEHTPRNLLIRAARRAQESHEYDLDSLHDIDNLIDYFVIKPFLLEQLSEELRKVRAQSPLS